MKDTRRRRCLATAALAALWLAAVPDGEGHLRRIGASLLAILDESDSLVIAEAISATRDDRTPQGELRRSRTSFALHRTITGRPPEKHFVVLGSPPALRYAAGARAIVALARPDPAVAAGAGDRAIWGAVQAPGAGLILATPLEPAAERDLAALWSARKTRGAAGERTAELLARLLEGTPRRLALLAAVDLADLAHAGPLPVPVERALRERLADPTLPPELRTLLGHALGTRAER